MSLRTAKLLLASVIIARSTSFMMTKIGIGTMSPFDLMGIRFLTAFIILLVMFPHRIIKIDRNTLICGTTIGIAFFTVMVAETFSLKTTESSVTALLENTAIVIVPLAEARIRRRLPDRKTLICALTAFAGVALMTFQGGSMAISVGKCLGMLAAFLYTFSIIVTDRLSKKCDAFTAGIIQTGTMGVLSMAASFIFESPSLPSSGKEWLITLFLAVICSSFGFALQPLAQKYTDAATTGIYCALSPLCAGIMGWVFLSEHLSFTAVIGAVLIILSIVIPYINKRPSADQEVK